LQQVAGKFTLPENLARRAPGSVMLDFSVYLIYRAVFALLNALPIRLLFAIGNCLGFCAWLVSRNYRQLAFQNAEIAFGGEKSTRELRSLVRKHFQRLGANLLCGSKLAAMPLEKARAHVTIENADTAHRELRRGRPIVLILSHLGSWELQAQVLPAVIGYVRNSTVFQPLSNRYIDKHQQKLRGRAGVELFNRNEGFQKAIELLRGGGAIGILSDQHAGDQGLWVPLFGRLASTTSLPALLAKRTGAAIIGTAIYTDGPGRWRMVFTEKIDEPGDSIEVLTAKANELLERQIRAAPVDWFWVHNRWKTPKPNFLLERYKRGVFLPDTKRANELKPFRILIRASNWLGDAVMSIPAIRTIKAGRPDAHITIVTPENLAPVWKLVPEVDEIISLRGKSVFHTVRQIEARKKFDVAILFPNSLRSALEVWLADVPRRVGYAGHFRAELLNQIIREPRKPGPPVHQSKRYLKIAEACGAEVHQQTPDVSSNSSARQSLAPPHRPSTISHQPFLLGLCPGAEYGPAKRWLPERFIEVGQKIVAGHNAKWVLFGTARDVDLGKQIAGALGDHCVNRIGQTTLQQLIDELRQCRLLLTNDTGTMHLAALLGVPTVSIFGSTEPAFTGPLDANHVVLRHHVECSPCFLRECPLDFRCMKAVTTAEVVDAINSVLRSKIRN
jgi:lipopolysaccharide heptosyltransferase II